MRRHALIFLVSIFLPSLVLGWLALRAAGKQRILIERQAADLHQAETDVLASELRDAIEAKQRAFAESVRALVAKDGAAALAENYRPMLATVWPDGGIPFAISPRGTLAYPSPAQVRGARQVEAFLANTSAFLANTSAEEIYQPQQEMPAKPNRIRPGESGAASYEQKVSAARPAAPAPSASSSDAAEKMVSSKAQGQNEPATNDAGRAASLKKEVARRDSVPPSQVSRNIVPQNASADSQLVAQSKIVPEIADFQTAVGAAAQGILARFVQNDLQVIFWTKPDPSANWLFGLALGPEELAAIVRDHLPENADRTTVLAILNDRARPVATSPEGATCDWKRPFVATEIGEVLPHWEVALYLANPGQLTESAHLVTVTLTLLIALAFAAILAGSYFVAAETRRQLALARKKTDFVANVSHELKTPLTSIRMFAELLADDRISDPMKRSSYLRIIASESERLTRLVNNVLDFSRLEKNRKTYDMRPCDIMPVVDRVWESESIRLQEAGFQVGFDCNPSSCPVRCDADAIAQVLVNLVSNAEKYSDGTKAIEIAVEIENSFARISVLDLGYRLES